MNGNYGAAFFLPLSENYHGLKLWPEQAAKHLCKSDTSCLWESRASLVATSSKRVNNWCVRHFPERFKDLAYVDGSGKVVW
ncbi:hypothetical protein BCR33DRAFT_714014 [Rhizoclosmatium globosum]|uniref:Uncharacterized protein n=1 Tax=Rhizoclosmatium globosum TaxID=329046 RepID=A0A1Y2CRC5_9FUNG|nr:hypothetical protein BCR33DRAFT_714014 [Rhizoclosmatium globosum]|eukprot:ORY48905.1 hypothetical protein BCR33DRAFT_714014 [Rhizoclosmatium globosum]